MHTTVFNLMGRITPIMEFKIQIHKKKKKMLQKLVLGFLGLKIMQYFFFGSEIKNAYIFEDLHCSKTNIFLH